MGLFNLIKQTKVSKELTYTPSEECLFYLDGAGVNCDLVVKKDDEVKAGQIIGKEREDLSIPVLSSVNGSVLEIRDTYNSQGKKVKAVVVKPDIQSNEEKQEVDINSLSTEEILNLIQKFGLIDDSGVPLSIKYRAFSGNKLLIKAFSFEPNFSVYGILSEKKKEFKKALEVLNKLFNGLETKIADEKIVKNKALELERDKLINKVFNSEIENKDVIIEDLLTMIYIGECFLTGMPHLNEYIVVSGDAVSEPVLLSVKIGTSIKEIFKSLNGKEEELKKTVIGGALKGYVQFSDDSSIIPNTKAILFLTSKEITDGETSPCIRCSKCLRACSKGLNPIKLMELWERGEKEEFVKFGGMKCIECGLCSYICPSKIELANKIVTAKTFIK